MTRIYYLHYQWLPGYVLSLSLFFYFPYVLFRLINADLIKLKSDVEVLSISV